MRWIFKQPGTHVVVRMQSTRLRYVICLLILPLPSLLVPTPLSRGGGGGGGGCYLNNSCPHEGEISLAIRDIFERLRNVKVAYCCTAASYSVHTGRKI